MVGTTAEQTSRGDRLGSTLFVAALVHGVLILGVTFTATSFDAAPLPALKVTLLVDSEVEQARPEDAAFLAQRNQAAAGGAAAGLRPTTALSAADASTRAGDPDGTDATDGQPRELEADTQQLATRGPAATHTALEAEAGEHSDAPRQAAVRIEHLAAQTLATELDLEATLPTGGQRTLIATPSAQQSVLAEYLDGWRRRVERVGTANFPAELLRDSRLGKPTLEVVIAADGRLQQIVVRRSSGDGAVDQAALRILRMASPFEPLPAHVRAEYDALRFAYDWDFFAGLPRTAGNTRPAQP